VQKLDGKG